MVALKGAQIGQFLQKPDKKIRAILVYGPDSGLVKERIDKLIIDFIGTKDDPFNLSHIEDSQLKDDPEKLRDEANAGSLMGGNRAVLINDAGDGLFKSIEAYLESPNDECLILARSGDLKPSSKIRKLFEKDKSSASIPCYSGDTKTIAEMINALCGNHNLKIEASARQSLMDILGSDFAVSKSEVEKLCIYSAGKESITIDDVEAVCGDNALITLDTLTDSLLTGDLKLFDRAYDKVILSGQPASMIILSVSRHFQKLHLLALHMEAGLNSSEALKRLTPPIHFKRKDSFSQQARIWKSADILSAQADLQICEKETRKKANLSNVIAHRALLKLGYIAKAKQRRN